MLCFSPLSMVFSKVAFASDVKLVIGSELQWSFCVSIVIQGVIIILKCDRLNVFSASDL